VAVCCDAWVDNKNVSNRNNAELKWPPSSVAAISFWLHVWCHDNSKLIFLAAES
jgi:hypothetical protein